MLFVIQSFCKLIADKVLNIDYDFIFNCKVLYVMLAICLLDHITLSFCEIVMSDWEYLIHDSSNLCDRTDLKLLLCCGSFCGIRIKKHAETETFVEIKWCYFNRLVDSIVISEFNYWQSVDSVILQVVHIEAELSLNLLVEMFCLAVSLRVVKYWN